MLPQCNSLLPVIYFKIPTAHCFYYLTNKKGAVDILCEAVSKDIKSECNLLSNSNYMHQSLFDISSSLQTSEFYIPGSTCDIDFKHHEVKS